MPKIPDLLDVDNALEHNVKDVSFCVTMNPSKNNLAVITPDQLMMSCGTKDLDHLNIHELKIHDAHITGDPKGAAGIVFHGKEPLATAQRATHIDATGNSLIEQGSDCVHVVATAAGLNHPISLNVGPSKDERDVNPAEKIRLGIARAARWDGVHHKTVDNHDDIQMFEKGGEKRYLFPSLEAGKTASAMTKLWAYNQENPDFMGKRYLKQNRTEVNGGIVVSHADFEAGKELLRANLTPKSNFAETGLVIKAVPVLGQQHTKGQLHLRFSALREPISTEQLKSGMKATGVAEHEGLVTLTDAQKAIGERPEDIEKLAAQRDGVSATHEDVFKAKLK